MKLKGKVALVTGGSSGIGRAIAMRFLQEGAAVMITGRREARLREVGASAYGLGDVRNRSDCERWVAQAMERFGKLNILVNAAGVIGASSIFTTTDEEWSRVMDSNLRGMFYLTRAAVPHLIKERGNSIVNISSVCSLRPYANLLPYCVSKAGTDMFTQCLALELAPHGVRVNAINPGVVVTELHRVSNAVPDYDAFLERSKTTHPLGRPGQPEEIANLALFLVSDEAGWITGGLYSIDGGRALTSAR